MSDWLYAATYAEAKLEGCRTELDAALGKIEKYEKTLRSIATDYTELSSEKAMFQRDDYKRMAKMVLIGTGALTINHSTPTGDIDDNF